MPWVRRRRRRLILPRRTIKKLAVGIGVVAVVALVVRYGNWGPSKDQYLARGDKYVESHKDAEAIIEYRNALRKDPKYGLAHAHLVDAYSRVGDVRNALRESIDAADLLPNDVDAQIKAGELLILARRFEDARARADRALALNPSSVSAQILKGNSSAGLNDLSGAVAEISQAIEMDPKDARSYTALGAMEMGQGRREEAEAAFIRAVETAPTAAFARLALANFYWAVGRQAEAEPLLARAVELDPSSVIAQRALATYYVVSGRPALAEAPLKAVADQLHDLPSRLALADYYTSNQRSNDARGVLKAAVGERGGFGPATVRLATLDYLDHNVGEARLKVNTVIAKEPKNVEALLLQAQLFNNEQKMDEALASVRAAVAADARSAPALGALASLLTMRGQVDEAIAALSELLKIAPRSVAAKIQLADLHLRNGTPEAAAQLTREVLKDNPKHAGAGLLLSRALIATGGTSEAAAITRSLLEEYPDHSALHTQMGKVLMVNKYYDAARREFDRGIELEPDSLEAISGRLSVDIMEKNAAHARATIDERLRKTPQHPGVLALAAGTYEALGDAAQQEAMLRRLIEADPGNLQAYSGLGMMYARQHRLDLAKAEYETMAAKAPKSIAAQTMIGIILQAQGKSAEAQKVYEKVVEGNPRAALAANNLAWLYVEQGGNLDIALQLAQTASQQLPEVPQVSDTLGWIYYQKNLAPLAIPLLQASVQRDPKNATYRYHLGLAYAKNGDKAKAKEALLEALARKPNLREADDALKALTAKS